MKWFRRLLILALLAVVAALGVLFWPRIRELWDRWMAGGGDGHQRPPERP